MRQTAKALASGCILAWCLGLMTFVINSQHYPANTSIDTEAIVILTGGAHRITEGLSLGHEVQCKKIFISGVNKNVSPNKLLRKLRKNNLPRSCKLELGYAAQNTRENALEVKEWLGKNKFSSILLVTSDYHMARSLVELKAVLPDTTIHPYPVQASVLDDKKRHAVFKHALFMFQEYHKYIAVWLRVHLIDVFRM